MGYVSCALLASPVPGGTGGASGGVWPLVWGLLGFAAILVIAYFGLRALSRKNLLGGRGRHMQILDRVVTGRDSTIVLVRVAGKVLIVGITKDSVRTLGEVNPEDLNPEGAGAAPPSKKDSDTAAATDSAANEATNAAAPAAVPAAASPRHGFFGRFVHNLGVYSGVLPKGTPPAGPERPSFQETLQKTKHDMEPPPATPSPVYGDSPDTRYGDEPSATPEEFEPPSILGQCPDYNEAIDRMKRFSRMDAEEKSRSEPTAADNLAFLRTARAFAEQAKHNRSEDDMNDLAYRIGKRTQRLTRRLEAGGVNWTE